MVGEVILSPPMPDILLHTSVPTAGMIDYCCRVEFVARPSSATGPPRKQSRWCHVLCHYTTLAATLYRFAGKYRLGRNLLPLGCFSMLSMYSCIALTVRKYSEWYQRIDVQLYLPICHGSFLFWPQRYIAYSCGP